MLFLMKSVPHRCNLTSVYSYICEIVPVSLFWVPNGLRELIEMFQIFSKPDWEIKNYGIFKRPIMVHTQILVHRWKPRKRIPLLFQRRTYPKAQFLSLCNRLIIYELTLKATDAFSLTLLLSKPSCTNSSNSRTR